MLARMIPFWFLLSWIPFGHAVIPDTTAPKQAIRSVSSMDVATWCLGLVVVLSVFFLCVWGMRKLSGIAVSGTEKMRMVGGLTLGLREKVILLQVGKKQLVLGVTPGRIETLLVLEGEDCLRREDASVSSESFAQKLAQALKAKSDA
jgi:flagellar protein FliO/FliZ